MSDIQDNTNTNTNTNGPKIDNRTISQPINIDEPELIKTDTLPNNSQELGQGINDSQINTLPNEHVNPQILEKEAINNEDNAQILAKEAINNEDNAQVNQDNAQILEKEAINNDDILENQAQVETQGKSNDSITVNIDKSTLVSLSQNLNTNLLVNISAYINVLTKLKDNESDDSKKSDIESNIQNLVLIQQNVSDILTSVQTNLDVPADQIINPETILQESSGNNSAPFMQKLLGAEASAILGSMAAATLLMGGKRKQFTFKKKRLTKRKKNTYKKKNNYKK